MLSKIIHLALCAMVCSLPRPGFKEKAKAHLNPKYTHTKHAINRHRLWKHLKAKRVPVNGRSREVSGGRLLPGLESKREVEGVETGSIVTRLLFTYAAEGNLPKASKMATGSLGQLHPSIHVFIHCVLLLS